MTDINFWTVVLVAWPLIGLAILWPFFSENDGEDSCVWIVTAFAMLVGPAIFLPVMIGLAMEILRARAANRAVEESRKRMRPHLDSAAIDLAIVRQCTDTADRDALDAYLDMVAIDHSAKAKSNVTPIRPRGIAR